MRGAYTRRAGQCQEFPAAHRLTRSPPARVLSDRHRRLWRRNVLVHQIESGLYRRQGKALTNFTRALPAPQSELAQQVVKDPYNFDFLTLSQEAQNVSLKTDSCITSGISFWS